jgi:predicted metal-binding protein
LCCPPFVPDYAATQRFLQEFIRGIIIQYTFPLNGVAVENFAAADLSMSNGLLEILLNLEREAFLQNHYKAFALKAGRCRLCKECNLKQCVNPTKARPSLEACGIDVMALANDNGYQAEILQAAVPELKIYGLLLVE